VSTGLTKKDKSRVKYLQEQMLLFFKTSSVTKEKRFVTLAIVVNLKKPIFFVTLSAKQATS
jgi:hypothetical protein